MDLEDDLVAGCNKVCGFYFRFVVGVSHIGGFKLHVSRDCPRCWLLLLLLLLLKNSDCVANPPIYLLQNQISVATDNSGRLKFAKHI